MIFSHATRTRQYMEFIFIHKHTHGRTHIDSAKMLKAVGNNVSRHTSLNIPKKKVRFYLLEVLLSHARRQLH